MQATGGDDRFDAGGRLTDDLESVRLQQRPRRSQEFRVVVDHQHTLAHLLIFAFLKGRPHRGQPHS
jgi:predicted SprT family Zn-dependent metalloprotease